MIIYWCKNKSKKRNEIKQIKTLPKYINSNYTPMNNSISNIDLISEFNELNSNNKTINYSFLSEEPEFIKNISNNENRYLHSEKSSLFFKEYPLYYHPNETIVQFTYENFQSLNHEDKIKLINEIFKNKKDNLYKNILSLINLCRNDNFIFNLIFKKISFSIIDIMKSKENLEIIVKLFEIISYEEKLKLIYSIVKKTNELLLDKRGYKILILLISLQKIKIINIILYFILQNFILYCGNPFSSEVIKALYELGEKYISSQLNTQLIKNVNEISKLTYGINIIIIAKKYNYNEI